MTQSFSPLSTAMPGVTPGVTPGVDTEYPTAATGHSPATRQPYGNAFALDQAGTAREGDPTDYAAIAAAIMNDADGSGLTDPADAATGGLLATANPTTLLQGLVEGAGVEGVEIDVAVPGRGEGSFSVGGGIVVSPAAVSDPAVLGHEVVHVLHAERHGVGGDAPETLARGERDAAEGEAEWLGPEVGRRIFAGEDVSGMAVAHKPGAKTVFSEPGEATATAEDCESAAFDAASMASSMAAIGAAYDSAASLLKVDIKAQIRDIKADADLGIEIAKGVAEGLSVALMPVAGKLGAMIDAELTAGIKGRVVEKVLGKIAGYGAKEPMPDGEALMNEMDVERLFEDIRWAAMSALDGVNQQIIGKAREERDGTALNRLAQALHAEASKPALPQSMGQNMLAGFLAAYTAARATSPETFMSMELNPQSGVNRDVQALGALKLVFVNGQVTEVEMPGMTGEHSRELIAGMDFDTLARLPITVAYQGRDSAMDDLLDEAGFSGEDNTLDLVVFLAEGRVIGWPGPYGLEKIDMGHEADYWYEEQGAVVGGAPVSGDEHRQHEQDDDAFPDANDLYNEAEHGRGIAPLDRQRKMAEAIRKLNELLLGYTERALRKMLARGPDGTIATSGVEVSNGMSP